MREITLPEINLPDFKVPEGLREMSRDDIVQAAREVRLPEIDLSKIDLPAPIADRLPGRRRSNPLIPIAVFAAIAATMAAAWWLITSPVTGPRARHLAHGLKSRLTGQRTDLIRYDDDADLGSLVSNNGATGSAFTTETGEPGEQARETVPSSF